LPEEVRGSGGQVVEPLSASTVPYTAPAPAPTFEPAPDATLDGVDLDIDFVVDGPDSPPTPTESTRPMLPEATMPEAYRPEDTMALESEPQTVPDGPLARKLELAEEFRQIGDIEGARDLLEEVVAKADGALKAKAQGMLEKPAEPAHCRARKARSPSMQRLALGVSYRGSAYQGWQSSPAAHGAGPAGAGAVAFAAVPVAPSAPAAPMPACTR
jgi:FimV-like protein